MLAAKTELKNAQKVKEYLLKKELIHPDFLLVKEFDFLYFPLAEKIKKIPLAEIINTKFSFPPKEKKPSFEEILKGKLTLQELEMLPKSQEIVGSILILEIPPELRKKEKMIADACLKLHPQIKTIVRKDHKHEGTYRTRKVVVLAGENTKETIHHESGVDIKVHLEKTYFSARSGNERLRIAKQVKKWEEVLVMFSGVGIYPLVIAKHSPVKHVNAIEINPFAHQYARENIELNHLADRITLYLGDVWKILPRLNQSFDRIVMPLPMTGEDFLHLALGASKKNAVIHLYQFLKEKEIPEKKKHLVERCKKLGFAVKILRVVKCGQFSPGVFRVCFDIKVT
ncbi:class I SAM-dependent methyltransferase family protein [Candidatus Woesearchaeota archaeon]|nr:class I SAM-dependent methyltransferase family protein [Candidatus Woesearchaeota archaeon]